MNSLEITAPSETRPVEASADEIHPKDSQAAAERNPAPAVVEQEVPSAQDGGSGHMRALIASLDLSEADWLRILNAHNGQPSERRIFFCETFESQAAMLGGGVYADAPCAESDNLGRRLNNLPFPYQVAVLEVIESFWSQPMKVAGFEEIMSEIGVSFCEAAHQRLQACKRRQEAFPSETEVVRQAHQSIRVG